MTALHRWEHLLERIEARCNIVDTGLILDHKPSPCHLWTGPDSGTGRGGGYDHMSLDGQPVAVHLGVFTHYCGYIPGKKQIDHKCNTKSLPIRCDVIAHKINGKTSFINK